MFIFYANTPFRRKALERAPFHAQRYCLYGYDQFRGLGWKIRHNLEAGRRIGRFTLVATFIVDRTLWKLGGRSGDFASVLAHRKAASSASLILSTVDSLGIPLALLKGLRLLHPPLIYISIGLPERVEKGFLSPRMREIYRKLFRRVDRYIAYGWEEARRLRLWLDSDNTKARVHFVPFGVDTDFFRPRWADTVFDVLSVGADSKRDFPLLLETARRNPWMRVRIVTNTEQAGKLAANKPKNIDIQVDLPFESLPSLYASARVVALPVKENTYSGATTTLLQAMAMAKPVVVSRVGAIREGYGFKDRVHLLWAEPEDLLSMERGILDLLDHPETASAIGENARKYVATKLRWDQYVNRMNEIMSSVAGPSLTEARSVF